MKELMKMKVRRREGATIRIKEEIHITDLSPTKLRIEIRSGLEFGVEVESIFSCAWAQRIGKEGRSDLLEREGRKCERTNGRKREPSFAMLCCFF